MKLMGMKNTLVALLVLAVRWQFQDLNQQKSNKH